MFSFIHADLHPHVLAIPFVLLAIASALHLFLGGWRGPGAEAFPLLGLVYFIAKTFLMYFLVMWVRYTFPRIRIDQMNSLNWKLFTPLMLAGVITTALAEKLYVEIGWTRFGMHTIANVILILGTLWVIRAYASSARKSEEALAGGQSSSS